jgi:CheY-like chemotaxis protein
MLTSLHLKLNVDCVISGREAVEAINRFPTAYALVLMDIQMPEMDGYEAVALIRAKGYSMPILAVTGNARVSDRERAQAAGFTNYITKPFNRHQLTQAIMTYGPIGCLPQLTPMNTASPGLPINGHQLGTSPASSPSSPFQLLPATYNALTNVSVHSALVDKSNRIVTPKVNPFPRHSSNPVAMRSTSTQTSPQQHPMTPRSVSLPFVIATSTTGVESSSSQLQPTTSSNFISPSEHASHSP